jgi:hypothetical protein
VVKYVDEQLELGELDREERVGGLGIDKVDDDAKFSARFWPSSASAEAAWLFCGEDER